jgi:lipoprotein-anchoring transpeptidase ErfK/SrfK
VALAAAATGTAVAVSLAGCTAMTTEAVRKAAIVPQVTITPAQGTGRVPLGTRITVHAANGTVRDVKIQTSGDPVTGRLSDNNTVWTSRSVLNASRRFTVVATVGGSGGKTVSATSSFRTAKPKRTFSAMTLLGYHQHYGVGIPIILNFNHAITRKAAVEKSIQLRTSKHVTGAWYWDGDKILYFRPRNYWPQHTRVSFDAKLNGVEGARGVYGTHDLRQSFVIGNSLIVVASTRSHYMHLYYKRKLYRTWPISTGRPGMDTPNGAYVTINKGNPVRMVGPGYDELVPWSVRFTWSGDYIHDAYWSVGEQGYVNVSHGCVNASPAHAAEYYKMAVPGDPVTITGSPKPGTWDDGWTVWFLSWHQLLKGSALHKAVVAGPHGSTFVKPGQVHATPAKAPLSRPYKHNARA